MRCSDSFAGNSVFRRKDSRVIYAGRILCLFLVLLFIAGSGAVVSAQRNEVSSAVSNSTKEPRITELPQANHLVFNGGSQPLIKEGKAEGAVLEYAIGKDEQSPPETGYSTEVPCGINPGTYYVFCRLKGETDFSPVCIKTVIEDLVFETEWETKREYLRNSNEPICFHFTTNADPDPADQSHFAGVLSNDVELDDNCYEIDWRAQKIRIRNAFMDRLEEGEYVIAVLFDVGEKNYYAEGRFTVREGKDDAENQKKEKLKTEPHPSPLMIAVLIPTAVLALFFKLAI